MREQDRMALGLRFEPGIAPFGERAVTGKLPIEMGFGNVKKLLATHVGFIEGCVHDRVNPSWIGN
jgi:hypothetical protein